LIIGECDRQHLGIKNLLSALKMFSEVLCR
jgi:hypothetical protein